MLATLIPEEDANFGAKLNGFFLSLSSQICQAPLAEIAL